jgi:hypothetical protein
MPILVISICLGISLLWQQYEFPQGYSRKPPLFFPKVVSTASVDLLPFRLEQGD